MKRYLFAFVLAVCCSCAGDSFSGSWGPAGCPPVGGFVQMQVQPATLQWFKYEDRPGTVYLYRGNTLVGAYTYADGFYREPWGNAWTTPRRAPLAPPLIGALPEGAGDPFGVDMKEIGNRQVFSHNGIETTRDEVEEAIGANLRDDSTGGHVTYIDRDKARRAKVAETVQKLRQVGKVPEHVRFQVYDPDLPQSRHMLAVNRLERDAKFQQTGAELLAQVADKDNKGKSPATQWFGEIGENELIQAVRKACPDWIDPRPHLPALPGLPDAPWEAIALVLVLCFACVVVARGNQS